MKLRNLLKHFENVDLDTEIYISSKPFSVITATNILVGSVLEISHPVFGKNLFILDEQLNRKDKEIVAVIIV